MTKEDIVASDSWQTLRRLTPARIALGRAGSSLPTAPMLDFQLAHARARDAVHLTLNATLIEGQLAALGLDTLHANSAAANRETYLKRPDLGRRLDGPSRESLKNYAARTAEVWDAVFVIADGLSALAVHTHAVGVLALALAALVQKGWSLGPVVVAQQSRVALGDEIGELLRSRQVAIFIGERPGLSAADSLGAYLTYAPAVGRNDAERNCISNIRAESGLSWADAAHKLVYLMLESQRRGLTGVMLKDTSDDVPSLIPGPAPS
ncbi:MAG: ethanolamine ammonia-lyase subunit EutC [Rhodocyclaceae bacterium]